MDLLGRLFRRRDANRDVELLDLLARAEYSIRRGWYAAAHDAAGRAVRMLAERSRA
jgi:hypothetical protein